MTTIFAFHMNCFCKPRKKLEICHLSSRREFLEELISDCMGKTKTKPDHLRPLGTKVFADDDTDSINGPFFNYVSCSVFDISSTGC